MKFDPELFDSSYWFQNAERLKISANVLKDKLYEQESEAEIIAVGTQNYHNQKLAFLQSYMMLIGFSLENLIKGFSIFRYKKSIPQVVLQISNS